MPDRPDGVPRRIAADRRRHDSRGAPRPLKVFMILSSLVLAVASALAVSSVSQPVSTRPKIVALGDSLTSGRGVGEERAWPALVQKHLDDDGFEYTIVNAGMSGDTSSGALRRLERALDGDVRVLIVALGANDGLR